MRVIAFRLEPGQVVTPHQSSSTVLVQVLEGTGAFRGESGEIRLEAGQSLVYAPGESHSMKPIEGPLRFVAILTPRPA